MKYKEESKEICQNLKEAIIYSDKSKSEIAKALGVSCASISQYLNGTVLPSLATLGKLCRYLDVSADDILKIRKK